MKQRNRRPFRIQTVLAALLLALPVGLSACAPASLPDPRMRGPAIRRRLFRVWSANRSAAAMPIGIWRGISIVQLIPFRMRPLVWIAPVFSARHTISRPSGGRIGYMTMDTKCRFRKCLPATCLSSRATIA